MMKQAFALAVSTILLSGCTVAVPIESAPQRIAGSAYRAPASLETLGIGRDEIAIRGTVVSIGDEAWYAPKDAVTGEPIGAVYYRPLNIKVDTATGDVGGEITLQVLSDIDPSIEISQLLPGDEVVALLYAPEERERVTLYGINFMGEVDKTLKLVDGLTLGDEQDMRLDKVLAKLKLAS